MDTCELIKNIGKLYRISCKKGLNGNNDINLKPDQNKNLISLIKDKDEELYNFVMSLDEKTKEELIEDLYDICFYCSLLRD
jgi:hypothetical protein